MQNHPAAHHALHLGPQDAAGNERKLINLLTGNHRVPGVGPALIANHDLVLFGQQVDDLAFGLVAPLQTDDTGTRHGNLLRRQKPNGAFNPCVCGIFARPATRRTDRRRPTPANRHQGAAAAIPRQSGPAKPTNVGPPLRRGQPSRPPPRTHGQASPGHPRAIALLRRLWCALFAIAAHCEPGCSPRRLARPDRSTADVRFIPASLFAQVRPEVTPQRLRGRPFAITDRAAAGRSSAGQEKQPAGSPPAAVIGPMLRQRRGARSCRR